MVELLLFVLLSLCGLWHLDINSSLQPKLAVLSYLLEGISSSYRHYSNTVGCSLSDACNWAGAELYDFVCDCYVMLSEVLWPKELNHIVHNEDSKFVLLLLV